MIKLLLPGIKLKRWLLIFFLGIIGLVIFIATAFAEELASFFTLLSQQLTGLASLPIHKYSPKLFLEIFLFILSIALIIFGVRGIISYLIEALIPEKRGRIWGLLYRLFSQFSHRTAYPLLISLFYRFSCCFLWQIRLTNRLNCIF